jgi:hypothetical protein
MKITGLIILLLLILSAGAQKSFYWVNLNKSPKLAKIWTTDAQSGTGSRTHSLSSVPSGAFLVITTQSEDDFGNATISSSPSLTWTKRADAQLTNSGNAEIWTATFDAGGSITITSNFGSNKQSSVAWVITGQEPTFGGATATATFQTMPKVPITSTRANSILIAVTSDWRANDGSGRAYRNTPTPTEKYYFFSSTKTTGYHYSLAAPTIANDTLGLTLPTGQQSGTAIIEIRSP